MSNECIALNGLILGACILAGKPWMYLLWIGSMLTTAMLAARVRSIAEHAVTPDHTDPFNNTRTTYARWWERLLFAPHHVNYHLEHHLLMTVPPYNLAKMHRILKDKGALQNACVVDNYGDVLKLAIAGR